MSTDNDLASVTGWRKATYSNENGSCVEVAQARGGDVAVRDTTDRGGPMLRVRPRAWRALTASVREGRVTRH
ncbi:MAG TPA: DUF397 domain-containing protein [Trebonia sp.]|jgi:hypothetical protein|nr:DUF397 domain-containing protein [Trebonia sp.]